MLSLLNQQYNILKFDNNNTSFILIGKNGYKVYDLDTLTLKYKNTFDNTIKNFDIICTDLLNDNNILIYVIKCIDNYKIIFYDNICKKILCYIDCFTYIYNIISTKTYIIIVTKNDILIYQLKKNNFNITYSHTIKTMDNDGNISVIDKDGEIILACYGLSKGIIHIKYINKNIDNAIKIFDDLHIGIFEISKDGKYIVVTDINGLYVKVIDIETHKIINTFTRGLSYISTTVYSIKFSNDNKYVVLGTKQKTIHVFKIDESYNDSYLNYIKYPNSILKIYITYDNYILNFDNNNNLVVISNYGSIDKYKIYESLFYKKIDSKLIYS